MIDQAGYRPRLAEVLPKSLFAAAHHSIRMWLLEHKRFVRQLLVVPLQQVDLRDAHDSSGHAFTESAT